jgi:hypothetical protein
MAEGGAEAVEKLRERQRKYGVATTEAGLAAEAFGDSQADLKASLGGVATVITSRLLPVLKPLIDRMAEFFANPARREAIGNKIKEIFERIATTLAGMDWSAIGTGIAKALDIGWGLLTGFVTMMTGLLNGDWKAVVEGFGTAWNAVKGPIGQVWEWIKQGFRDLLDWMAEHLAEWFAELPGKLAEGTKNAIARSIGGMVVSARNAKFESRRRPVLDPNDTDAGTGSGEWGRWLGLDRLTTTAPAPTAVPNAASKSMLEITIRAAEGTAVTATKATGPAAKSFSFGRVGANLLLQGRR